MTRPPILHANAGLVVALAMLSACGDHGRTPVEPGRLRANTLSVSTFSVSGLYDAQFHYFPRLSVSSGANGGAIDVVEMSFEGSEAGVTRPLQHVRYSAPQRVPAGRTLELTSNLEIVSTTRVDHLQVTVAFVDETGRSGTVTAHAAVPAISQESADATLALHRFSVVGWSGHGRFHYWPKLTLSETSGRSAARILKMTFELLDVGPSGLVPHVRQAIDVPAGGTIVLDENDYDHGPWVEIDSTANASRVSVVISFVDDQGRGGVVSAVAQVSR